MVQSNELRIGNWLYVGNSPEPWKMQLDEDSMEVLMGARDYHNFSPIPLSAEILEKAGFTCSDYKTRKKYSIGYFQISLYPNGDVIFIWSGKVVYIKSVHQLQNLYFALTGEELPVEL